MQETTEQTEQLGLDDNKIFIGNPARTLEWLGAVSYSNLEKVFARIKELMIEDKNAPIYLMVNSFGGATGIAMSFYDAVQSWLRPNLITIGSGDVDSSGIIVMLAGRRIYITRNTTLLLHLAGRSFAEAKRFSSADMDNMIKEDRLKDYQYASILATVGGGKYGTDKILEMMAKNTIMTAEEAVNMGLAQEVI